MYLDTDTHACAYVSVTDFVVRRRYTRVYLRACDVFSRYTQIHTHVVVCVTDFVVGHRYTRVYLCE